MDVDTYGEKLHIQDHVHTYIYIYIHLFVLFICTCAVHTCIWHIYCNIIKEKSTCVVVFNEPIHLGILKGLKNIQGPQAIVWPPHYLRSL